MVVVGFVLHTIDRLEFLRVIAYPVERRKVQAKRAISQQLVVGAKLGRDASVPVWFEKLPFQIAQLWSPTLSFRLRAFHSLLTGFVLAPYATRDAANAAAPRRRSGHTVGSRRTKRTGTPSLRRASSVRLLLMAVVETPTSSAICTMVSSVTGRPA